MWACLPFCMPLWCSLISVVITIKYEVLNFLLAKSTPDKYILTFRNEFLNPMSLRYMQVVEAKKKGVLANHPAKDFAAASHDSNLCPKCTTLRKEVTHTCLYPQILHACIPHSSSEEVTAILYLKAPLWNLAYDMGQGLMKGILNGLVFLCPTDGSCSFKGWCSSSRCCDKADKCRSKAARFQQVGLTSMN